MYSVVGFEKEFGRKDVIKIVGMSQTTSGDLIRKMKNYGLIKPVSGQGKRKYRFIR